MTREKLINILQAQAMEYRYHHRLPSQTVVEAIISDDIAHLLNFMDLHIMKDRCKIKITRESQRYESHE